MRKLAAAILTACLVAVAAACGGAAASGAACAARGPTPQGAPITAADRAAVPFASQGLVVVTVGSRDRLAIVDLATGRQRSVESGIDEPHELAVSSDGRWVVAADFGDYLGDFSFSGMELGVYRHADQSREIIGYREGPLHTPAIHQWLKGYRQPGRARRRPRPL